MSSQTWGACLLLWSYIYNMNSYYECLAKTLKIACWFQHPHILLAAAWPVHRPSSFCCACTWHLPILSVFAGSTWIFWILASAWIETPWTTVPMLLRRIHTWATWMSSAEGGHGTCTVRCLKENEHPHLNFWYVHGPTPLFLFEFSVESTLAILSACMQQVYSNISKGTTTTFPLPQAKAHEAS